MDKPRVIHRPIEVRLDNWLHKEGELLTAATCTPYDLGVLLDQYYDLIEGQMQTTYEKICEKNPNREIYYPWLYTVKLAKKGESKSILTEVGLEPPYHEISNTVHTSVDALREPLRKYWHVAGEAGYIARLLTHLDGGGAEHDGTWLQVMTEKHSRINTALAARHSH